MMILTRVAKLYITHSINRSSAKGGEKYENCINMLDGERERKYGNYFIFLPVVQTVIAKESPVERDHILVSKYCMQLSFT